MKRFVFVLIWLLVTPALFAGAVGWAYAVYSKPVVLELAQVNVDSSKTLSAGDSFYSQVKGLSTDIQTEDARPVILAEFLRKYDSPLKPYDYWGEFLTDLADRYNMDFRLLPSISMQESNLCKKIPHGSFNCLGLGIHSRGTWEFERFEDNFEAAAKVLRNNYLDKGYITPDEIQDKYTPGSNGSWEFAVNHFMDVLETAEF